MSPDIETYILQKDLPDAKAGDRYTKSIYDSYYSNRNKDAVCWEAHIVENNPEWFLLEEKAVYTKTEYIKGIKNAFMSSRLNHPMVGLKYDKIEDYLKTLNL